MSEPTLSIESLERQRGIWLELAGSLERAQVALLCGDVAGFEECTREQNECCEQLVPQAELDRFRGDGQIPISLFHEIDRARRRVRHLNCVHAALLRRAIRSLAILRNLMSQRGTLYAPSACWQQHASTLCPRE